MSSPSPSLVVPATEDPSTHAGSSPSQLQQKMVTHESSQRFSPSPLVVSAFEDPSTHAGCNPSQLQQKTCVLNQQTLSLAQKATCSLQQASTHAKAEELAKDLGIILTCHNAELEIFAKDHNTKMDYITKLTSQSTHYKKKRAATIQNTMLHLK